MVRWGRIYNRLKRFWTDWHTGGELRNGMNGFLMSYATDSVRLSQQIVDKTRSHDEWVHKITNIIYNYRFVKPYIIHNIA